MLCHFKNAIRNFRHENLIIERIFQAVFEHLAFWTIEWLQLSDYACGLGLEAYLTTLVKITKKLVNWVHV